MERDFAFFCSTLLSSSREEVEESLASKSLTFVSLIAFVPKVQRERREVMMQMREHGESKQCLREQKRRLQSIGERWKKRFLSILPLPLITTSLCKTGFSKSPSTCKDKSSLALV